jgi:hypothetical protein
MFFRFFSLLTKRRRTVKLEIDTRLSEGRRCVRLHSSASVNTKSYSVLNTFGCRARIARRFLGRDGARCTVSRYKVYLIFKVVSRSWWYDHLSPHSLSDFSDQSSQIILSLFFLLAVINTSYYISPSVSLDP